MMIENLQEYYYSVFEFLFVLYYPTITTDLGLAKTFSFDCLSVPGYLTRNCFFFVEENNKNR